jgi:hypothetical protein
MATRYTTGAQRLLQTQGCTVTVYDAGTSNVSTIYANPQGDVLANPFVWAGGEEGPMFYAAVAAYDVKIEGAALPTLQRFVVEEDPNANIYGTLKVVGASTLVGNVGVTGTLDVTGVASFTAVPKFTVTQATVGSAGAAANVPASAAGYMEVKVGTTAYVIPYFAKA